MIVLLTTRPKQRRVVGGIDVSLVIWTMKIPLMLPIDDRNDVNRCVVGTQCHNNKHNWGLEWRTFEIRDQGVEGLRLNMARLGSMMLSPAHKKEREWTAKGWPMDFDRITQQSKHHSISSYVSVFHYLSLFVPISS